MPTQDFFVLNYALAKEILFFGEFWEVFDENIEGGGIY